MLGCGLAHPLDEVVAPRLLALGGEEVLAELEFPPTSFELAEPGLVVGSVLLHAVKRVVVVVVAAVAEGMD